MNNDSIHIGSIIESKVKQNGIKIAVLARKINKSRRFIYILFANKKVPLHYVKQIGNVLNYDFSSEISGIQKTKENDFDFDFKNKYLKLLEEHNELLKKYYEK
jgi:hypothetical protein